MRMFFFLQRCNFHCIHWPTLCSCNFEVYKIVSCEHESEKQECKGKHEAGNNTMGKEKSVLTDEGREEKESNKRKTSEGEIVCSWCFTGYHGSDWGKILLKRRSMIRSWSTNHQSIRDQVLSYFHLEFFMCLFRVFKCLLESIYYNLGYFKFCYKLWHNWKVRNKFGWRLCSRFLTKCSEMRQNALECAAECNIRLHRGAHQAVP